MMFAVQLGGKVSKPDSATSMSTDFRNAVLFQENDNGPTSSRSLGPRAWDTALLL